MTSNTVVAAFLIAIFGCTESPPNPASGTATTTHSEEPTMHQVTGTVTYRERIALTPGAVVNIRLLDVSRADVMAEVLAEQTIENPGNVPIAFSIDYDPHDIDDRMSYVVRAEITERDQLMFTTDTSYPVITRGAGHEADLMLIRVSAPPGSSETLAGGSWRLIELRDEQVPPLANDRRPDLTFDIEAGNIAGFSGCNRYSGSFEARDGEVSTGPIAGTRMMCSEGMEIEREFLGVLESFDRYELTGNFLTLFAGGEPLARFERG